MIRRVRGAIILGVLATTLLSFLLGGHAAARRRLQPAAVACSHRAAARYRGRAQAPESAVAFIIFIMAFVDTVGTLIGLSARGGFLDEEGNLPEIEKPMLADALANLVAPVLGTTTTGAYIESAAGHRGGRKDRIHVPGRGRPLSARALFRAAPDRGACPCLRPGADRDRHLDDRPITRIDFSDYTELIPAFLTIVLMVFTYNIGVGMTAGLLAYPVLKTLAGRGREVRAGMLGVCRSFAPVLPYLSLPLSFRRPFHHPFFRRTVKADRSICR